MSGTHTNIIPNLVRTKVLYTNYSISRKEEKQVQERTFGKLLQNERKKRGITQKDLSEMTGFTQRVITYWETDKHDISLKNAEIVAKALGITITIGKKK